MRLLIFYWIATTIPFTLIAQDGIGIGTDSPNESAVLHIQPPNNNKGMLIPRLTTTQRNTISTPAEGLIVYNSSVDSFEYYDGSSWIRLIPNPAKFNLNLSNNRITNLAAGTNASDAVNKSQAETISRNAVEEYGVINKGNTGSYNQLNMRVFEIGGWDMDNSASKWVDITAIGSANLNTLGKVRFAQAMIIEDDQTSLRPLNSAAFNSTKVIGSVFRIEIVNLVGGTGPILGLQLDQATGEHFDSSDYDDSSVNRGWVTVFYEE